MCIGLQATMLLKKENAAQVLSSKFCETLKNTFSITHFRATTLKQHSWPLKQKNKKQKQTNKKTKTTKQKTQKIKTKKNINKKQKQSNKKPKKQKKNKNKQIKKKQTNKQKPTNKKNKINEKWIVLILQSFRKYSFLKLFLDFLGNIFMFGISSERAFLH